MLHALKTLPCYFEDILEGSKTFEVRKNDRPFATGDEIVLQEWNPEQSGYTGNEWYGIISYVMDETEYCKKGYVILGIKQKEVLPVKNNQ